MSLDGKKNLPIDVTLTLSLFVCWLFLHALCHLLSTVSKHSFRNTSKVSNTLDPDQARHISRAWSGLIKVRKTARIRNLYNQVPHLSQDTKWESNKITINITNKSQEVSPFPSGDQSLIIMLSRASKGQNHISATQAWTVVTKLGKENKRQQ